MVVAIHITVNISVKYTSTSNLPPTRMLTTYPKSVKKDIRKKTR